MADDTQKKNVSPESKKITLALARVLFRRDWKQENPNASADARKAAFKESRKEYMQAARRLRNQLAKNGVSMNLDAGDS